MLLCSSVSDLSLTFLSSVRTVMKDLFPDCLFDCDWMKQNQILHLFFFFLSFFLLTSTKTPGTDISHFHVKEPTQMVLQSARRPFI